MPIPLNTYIHKHLTNKHTHTYTHTFTHIHPSGATNKQEFSGFYCTEGNWYKQLCLVSPSWTAISGRLLEEQALSFPQASGMEKTASKSGKCKGSPSSSAVNTSVS